MIGSTKIGNKGAPQKRAKRKPANQRTKSTRNDLNVLRLIHSNRDIARIDLARQTGLSTASMTAIVHRLVAKGFVTQSGKDSPALGRKRVALRVSNRLGHVVGVDIGSFLTRVVVAEIAGNVLYKEQMETKLAQGRNEVLSRTFKAIHRAIRESGVPKDKVHGIGMAHSGVVDSEAGVVLSFPRPGQMTQWKNVPLRDMLEKEFGVPSVLDDSARTMAIAEKYFGVGSEMSDFVYVEVGMGIGASIFIDGKLYRGFGGTAGEFGHMTANESGPICSCGNNGCLEAVASCAAMIQAVRIAIEKGVNSSVTELAQGDLDRISIELIVQAARENDTLAFRVLHEAISHIGVILADVVNLLNPSAVVLGGPLFSAGGELLFEPLKRVIRQRVLEKPARDMELKLSTLGPEAGAVGAARLMSEKALEQIYLERA